MRHRVAACFANVRHGVLVSYGCVCVACRHKDGLLAPFMPEVHPDAVLILEDDAELKPRCVDRSVDWSVD